MVFNKNVLKFLVLAGLLRFAIKALRRRYRVKQLLKKRGDGKTVIVTGAASGVGRATALLMGKLGWRVFCCDVNEKGLNELKAQNPNCDFVIFTADLSKQEGCEAFHSNVVKDELVARSGVDVLVNCAGIVLPKPNLGLSYAAMDLQVKINLLAPMYLSKLFVKDLIRSKNGGAIVNVSSVSGAVAWPWQGAYAPTKFGVEGFSDVLRREAIANNLKLRVCSVMPGAIDTPLIDRIESSLKEFIDAHPDDPFVEGIKGNYKTVTTSKEYISTGNRLIFVSPEEVAQEIYVAGTWQNSPHKRFVVAPAFNVLFTLLRFLPTYFADRLLLMI